MQRACRSRSLQARYKVPVLPSLFVKTWRCNRTGKSSPLIQPSWATSSDQESASIRVKRPCNLACFAQGDHPIGFEGDDEVLVESVTNKGEIVLGRKPAIRQDITVFNLIVLTPRQHRAKGLILGHFTFTLDLPRFRVRKNNWLADELKGYRDGQVVDLVNAVE